MELCKLCERELPEAYITDHHLTPENRKQSDVVDLCQPCHNQVHAMFTNDELKEEYNSIAELKAADRIEAYIEWIADTDHVNITVDESNRVRRLRNG